MHVLKVGRYRVLERLGEGASADVYLAEDTIVHRKVALKLLRLATPRTSAARFEREARARRCSIIRTSSRCSTSASRTTSATSPASMWKGRRCGSASTHGPLPISEVVDVALGVASALVAAHEAWIVHRDVKPENIMLRRDRRVKVLDFGVAKLAGGGDATDPLRRAATSWSARCRISRPSRCAASRSSTPAPTSTASAS